MELAIMADLSVQNFWFEGKDVRFVGTPENPEWIAADVFAVLDVKWDGHNLDGYDEEEKGRVTIPTLGGCQELLTLTEPGMYRTVFKSRKPSAKRFQRWVFHEVLPAIRATGKYSRTQEQPKLPPHQEAKEVAETIVYIQDYLAQTDPRLAQILIDRAMQTVQPLLMSSAPEVKLSGSVEIAELLGLSVGKEQSTLGRTVAKAWRDAYGTEPQEVKRECGGAMRKLKVYPTDEPIVIAAIKEFYSDREVA
jgi:prophage antirepressor-like protein